jgi:hypothetical protein
MAVNDAVMVGVVLTLVFGAIIFFLYNRLTLTERKMGLFEGVLTDLKIMMDAAPFASGPPPQMREFEPTPEYLNAISGPVPLQNDEVEEYQQTLEQALDRAQAVEAAEGAEGAVGTGGTGGTGSYRTLQIDEVGPPTNASGTQAISVTKLSPDLDAMTVKELHALAKGRAITVPAGTRRKDLIDLLKKSDSSEASLEPEPSVAPADIDGAEPAVEGSPF